MSLSPNTDNGRGCSLLHDCDISTDASLPRARRHSPAAARLLGVGALLAVLLGNRSADAGDSEAVASLAQDSLASAAQAASIPDRSRLEVAGRAYRISQPAADHDSLGAQPSSAPQSVAARPPVNFATRLRDVLYQILGQSTVDILVVFGGVVAAVGLLARQTLNWSKMHDEDECSANVTFLAGNVMTTRGYFGVENIRQIWPNAVEQQMIRHAERQANSNKEWPFAGFRPDERGRKIFRKLRSVISREVESFKLWEVRAYSERRLNALRARFPLAESPEDRQTEADAPNQAFLALSYEVNKEGHMRVNTLLGADLIDMLADLEKWYRHTPLGKSGDRAFCGDTQRLVTNLEMAVSIVLQQPHLVKPLVAAHPELWDKVERTAEDLRRLLVLNVEESCEFLWGYLERRSETRVKLNASERVRLKELWTYRPGLLDHAIGFLRREPVPNGVPHWFTVMDLWNPEAVLPQAEFVKTCSPTAAPL